MRIEPKKILCAIDFSDFTNLIVSYGKSLAVEFNSKLCLCHIVPGTLMVSSHMPPYLDYAGIESERIRNAEERLEKLAEEIGTECEIIVAAGHPPDEIEQISREKNMDMVIAATHGGSGVKRFLIGSVTNRLVKILECPFLVLHTPEDHVVSPVEDGIKLKRILVGCDFSPDSKLAFDYALSLAQEFQTQLYLAHIIRPMEHQVGEDISWIRAEHLNLSQKTIEEEKEKKQIMFNRLEKQLINMVPEDSRNWCTPVTVILEGEPYKELIDYAEKKEMDMIILGVRGHSLLERFLVGSTTDRVISRSQCPVMAVRHVV
ncbi:universal stress protein [Desulfobacula phenolica]|uniref:Nucleotide-binding universal stress protein, UspA family n=1 Tax=Desulfobacula phenolica TaxID=90732 RepID=A0A1H2G8F9_9BACT|nr:universal stress protein [Desulfobacula phenolica]SDU15852.1 Nucleotide-binding universal stress protein, UspA family [Desulfobacula phenolica]